MKLFKQNRGIILLTSDSDYIIDNYVTAKLENYYDLIQDYNFNVLSID